METIITETDAVQLVSLKQDTSAMEEITGELISATKFVVMDSISDIMIETMEILLELMDETHHEKLSLDILGLVVHLRTEILEEKYEVMD